MKKTIICLFAALTILCLAACGNPAKTEPAETKAPDGIAAEAVSGEEVPVPGNAEDKAVETTDAPAASNEAGTTPPPGDPAEHSDTLVVYFSATGTTKGVAEKIAAITDADLYEITAAEPYSAEDLNYNDQNSRTTKEQNDKSARPEIGSEALDLSGYKTVYLGFPIWWGEEPRIMDSFVEGCSFDGIAVIPFCTSSSSGIGRSGPNMEALAGSGTWLDGKRFSGGASEAELRSWIEGQN